MIKIKRTKDNFKKIHHEVLNKVFQGHPIENVSHSIRKVDTHSWGPPIVLTNELTTHSTTKYAHEKAIIKVDEWLKIQYNASNSKNRNIFNKRARDKTKGQVKDSIANNNEAEIPATALVLKPEKFGVNIGEDYTYIASQEGRSRGLGTKKAGLEYIPIWIVVRRARK